MLFLSDAVMDAKTRLVLELDDPNADSKLILEKILDLDPDDSFALMELADLYSSTGDDAAAEKVLWRAMQCAPCTFRPYHNLGVHLVDQESLSKGLLELSCRKLLHDEEVRDKTDFDELYFNHVEFPGSEGLGGEERLKALADWLHEGQEHEPEAVAERLRPYRLIHQLQETESLDRSAVDAILKEGASMVPILIGVIRDWLVGGIPDCDAFAAENSLALLGEIGDASAIPEVMEMVGADDADLPGAARWALDRIISQHPLEAAQMIGEMAPSLDMDRRVTVAETLMRNPQLDPSGVLYEKLFENLDRIHKQDRDLCFQMLITTGFVMRGESAAEITRGLLRRHASLISRKAGRIYEEMIQDFASDPSRLPKPLQTPPSTVYHICAGEVVWPAEEDLEENDEDEYYPEPIQREFRPGRNDPCWCGSGKKYKKCHLDADEQHRHTCDAHSHG